MKYLYVKPVFLWLSAIAVMFLGACTSEVPGTSETAEAISFGVPQTRAAVEKPSDMEAFSVWGWYTDTETGGDPVSVFDETRVDQASGWNYEGGTRYWIPGKTYRFYGVYPHGLENVSCTDEGTLHISNFDCSTSTDLMVASRPDIVAEDGISQGVQLSFRHLLARVEIVAKQHSATMDIQGFKPRVVSAKLYGMSKTADFNATINESIDITSAWGIHEVFTTAEDPLLQLDEGLEINSTQEISVMDILLFPQLIQKEYYLEITFSTDGGNTVKPTQKIQLTTLPITQWEAGKHYYYSFTISADDRILFDKPTVTEWDEAVGGIIIVE